MYFSDNTVKKWYFQCVMCYPRLFILGQAALAIKHTSSENCLMKDQHKSLTLNRREQLMIALALLGNGAVLFKTDIVVFSVWTVKVALHSAPKH